MKQPALFLSHGAPTIALADDDFTRALTRHGKRLDSARALLVMSAHWESAGKALASSAERPETIHDFGGFAAELHALHYPARGEPALAADIVRRLSDAGLRAGLDPTRGLDHGVWTPLLHLRPLSDLPVVPLSLPRRRTPEDVVAMGRALSGLRDDGVALIGTGGITHNLALLGLGANDAPTPEWARAFDAWAVERAGALDTAALCAYREHSEARLAVPSSEHFDPLLFAVGAAREDDAVTEIYRGFSLGALSMACLAFG